MRKYYFFFVFFWGLAFLQAQDFSVQNYKVDITIHKEGYFDVVEDYDVNFEVAKHGIFRTIKTKYEVQDTLGQARTRKIKIDKIQVPGHKFDAPYEFVQKMSDEVEIKIGDKDVTVIGPKHYQIRYRVHNAFLFEPSRIHFYWNILPDGWQADFHQVSFTVHVPQDVYLSKENSSVYSGASGTSGESTDFQTYFSNGEFSGISRPGFVSQQGESVTVLIDLPLASVVEAKPFWPFWTYFGWVFLILLMVVAYFKIWWDFGKDDRVIEMTTYYPPENIDPAMVGFLINDREDNSDLISLLAYWGAKGLIRIEELPKKHMFSTSGDSKLIALAPLPEGAPEYERLMFQGLFGDSVSAAGKSVLVSSLKNSFYGTMEEARAQLKKEALPYYVAKSRKVQFILYIVIFFLGILLSLVGLFYWGIVAAVALLATCAGLMYLNQYMIKKSHRGNRVLSELKGFKRFIKVAEENKLRVLLQENPHYFENTMAYAVAFGLFKQWAKKFNGLEVVPPQWYVGSSTNMGMNAFSRSFSNTLNSSKSNMVSTPPSSSGSSGSGGFSGGGFGGGGGGSW